MRQWLTYELLDKAGTKHSTMFLSYALTLAAIAAICLGLWLLVRSVAVWVARKITRRTKSHWDDILFKNKVFQRACAVVVPLTIASFSEQMTPYEGWLVKSGHILSILVIVLVAVAVLRSINDIYGMYEISKTRPIRGLLQAAQVAAYIIGAVVAAAILAGESPMVLLGGVGAMTAVITLIFKDAILGFVSGIQLTGNDMIRIGDWIEAPKYSANGIVTDLSMTTVKVENFDKTVTAVPAYTLVSDAFINWRGMVESDSRRIKRAIYINVADVRFCDEAMIERFSRMELLQDYIAGKLPELEEYNRTRNVDLSQPVNGRRITNLGTFRAYIMQYLLQHPRIRTEMACMVRQLSLCEQGIPLEIYAFANTSVWAEYESIQADIFDHIYAVVSEFGLQIYQKPSASDFRRLEAGHAPLHDL